jgi:tetratricopeptide (TPR) repeat protein
LYFREIRKTPYWLLGKDKKSNLVSKIVILEIEGINPVRPLYNKQRMKRIFILLLGLALCLAGLSTHQEVTTIVTVYDDIFLTEQGFIPPPENAIELEHEFTIESIEFRSPIQLATDPEGNIYTSAKRNSAVYKMDAAGELQLKIGKPGRGKGSLPAPANISTSGDYLIVHDTEKQQLEFLDFEGDYVKSRKISDFTDFVLGEDEALYVAHHVEYENSPLITVYFPDGKKLSFGKPLLFRHSMQVLNSRSLELNGKGELYVAFTYFPIVRKYSASGKLLDEYRINSPIMEVKKNYNLKKVGEGIAQKALRAGYRDLIVGIRSFENKIYLLSHVPRLEITEMDEEGTVTATYWMDSREVYETHDFVIREIDGVRKFYVSHTSPSKYDIDVLGIKARKAQESLEGEIADLTEEIAANPDFYQAYNNRGVARYRLEDYQGAIEDFSRAIDLAPDSALSYNNRGLAKVKTKDLDGAVKDFTRAIDLDPGNAKIFFNRGIALARKEAYHKAIEDFKKAADLDPDMAKKAREQIYFCLSQLKKQSARSSMPLKLIDLAVFDVLILIQDVRGWKIGKITRDLPTGQKRNPYYIFLYLKISLYLTS